MSKAKFALATLAVLLVVSGATSVTTIASGHNYLICKNVGKENGKYKNSKCKAEGGEREWEASPIQSKETFGVLGEGGTATLESSLLKLECTTSFVAESSLAAGGASTLGVAVLGCKNTGNPECPMAGIKLHASGQLYTETVVSEGGILVTETWNKLTLQSGSEANVGGSEACKTRFLLRGTLRCALPNGTEMKEVHELDCKASDSELEVEPSGLEVAVSGTYGGSEQIETSPHYWAVD